MIELLEHNVETYQNLCKEIEKHNKVALIQATATGKSYIISKYIEEHCHNALILVPANAIGDQWKKLLPNTEVKTYQAMAKRIEGEYDLIVADEMHHLGSDVWGQKFIEYFMQNPGQKVIGATATEIRYLDNSRDMVKELFDGVAVYGVDITGAINQGILPTFKYVSAYYGTEEDYNEYREKCGRIADKEQSEELSRRLELCIQNQISIKEAMHENLNTKDHKIIVFLNGICEIEQAVKMFHDIFPNCECNYVSSKESTKANDEAITKYQTSDAHISILFAIDMLNEGVHIGGTDCVVMFRNTISPQIYFQQLGRALSAKVSYEPIVFDFACNSSSIAKIEKHEDAISDVITRINGVISDKKRKIIIQSYVADLESILQDISDRLTNCLTEYEKEYIQIHTEMSCAKLAKDLNRPYSTIYNYAKRENIMLADDRKWFSEDEDNYLRENAGKKRLHELAKDMDREENSIKCRCEYLGILYKKCGAKEEHLEYVKNNTDKTARQIATVLGIEISRVYAYAKKLGLHLKKTPQNEWTETEDEYLRKNAFSKTNTEIGKALGRSEYAVQTRMNRIGIRKRGGHDRRYKTSPTTQPLDIKTDLH